MRFDWKAIALAGVMSIGGLGGISGCGGTEGSEGDTVTGTEASFHWRGRRPNMGRGTGGAPGGVSGGSGGVAGGDTSGCDVCTRAQVCCNATATASCTFSASTCASLAPTARDAYIVACKTMIHAVVGTRSVAPDGCFF